LKSFLEMQELVFHMKPGKRVTEVFPDNHWLYCDQLPHSLFGCDVFGAEVLPEDVRSCLDGYDLHNKKVRETIPPERLLVFNVKDGWGPLCEFLGKPVPSIPFPFNNEYVRRLRMMEQQKLEHQLKLEQLGELVSSVAKKGEQRRGRPLKLTAAMMLVVFVCIKARRWFWCHALHRRSD